MRREQYSQHDKVMWRIFFFTALMFIGFLIFTTMPSRYCADWFPLNVPCLKYAYAGDWIYQAAVSFTFMSLGALFALLNAYMIGNLPQDDDDTMRELTWRMNLARQVPTVFLQEKAPGKFSRELTGLSNAEWAQLCFILRTRTDWQFSRARLKAAGMELANDRYTQLNSALTSCGVVVNNYIPEEQRHWFDLRGSDYSPTLTD